MSTRVRVRRKVVLAVTVSRSNGQDKQIAHTLDITATSARLGGVSCRFEPGEVIDIQRGAVKGRFRVVWVGKAGSSTERQVGVRSLEANKVIWGVDLPQDESDAHVNVANVRNDEPVAPKKPMAPGVAALEVEAQPARVLIAVCKTLAANFEAWQSGPSTTEMEELRKAVSRLHHVLSSVHESDMVNILSTSVQTSGQA